MKILILGFTKLAYMPYMNIHLELLRKLNAEIHLVYWNRDGKPDINFPEGVICHEFNLHQKDEQPKWSKIKNFLKYSTFVKKILSAEKFDRIIVLSTIPAVLLTNILMIKYKRKFIFDYRDVTFEQLPIYRFIVGLIAKCSSMTLVSSNAFRKFLPPLDNIYTSHNILLDALEKREIRCSQPRIQQPIRVRYWGLIRHKQVNCRIIDALTNDKRYELHYHGRMEDVALDLQNYCHKNKITNVFFHGSYLPNDRYQYIESTDILHNMFDNDVIMQPAMANKLYDGIVHYIPQICSRGSYMGEIVTENGIGMALDPEQPRFADDLYSFYSSIDWKSFKSNADKLLNKVISEDEVCRMAILKAIQ